MILVLFFTTGIAAPLSDSLLIEGHYSQKGKSISRRKLEKFLQKQDVSMSLVKRSKAWRISAWTIGASMWCVNIGITAYQVRQFMDAVEKQQPINTNLASVTVPLIVGGEIAAFVQGRLRTRSEYLLHKAVTAYNNDVCQRHAIGLVMDHRITKVKSSWYRQDRVLMPTRVLYPVLKEKDASRSYANCSFIFRELGNQSVAAGAMFLALAAIGYIQKDSVDTGERDFQLYFGIGLASFGIINKIISAVTRNAAVRRYNESIPESTQPAQDRPALEQH
jgi:hypothetical protein